MNNQRVAWIIILLLLMVGLVVATTNPAAADPASHSAGDYFVFAKAAATGVTSDRKANEPTCDSSNDKQADFSGSNSQVYGRLHSNADIAISGSNNVFNNTISPNPEITFGTHPGNCQSQADGGNTYASGGPTNIDTLAYQVDPATGWPGNLGSFLNAPGYQTFNTIEQVLGPGAVCDIGSLTQTSDIAIAAANNGQVVCNGTGKITIGVSNLGTAANPFRITMISHGLIEISGSNHYLEPAAHGILAWTDQPFGSEANSIKIAGSNVNITSRAILFTPRSGQDVSGSNNATLCIQMIGQGSLKVAGSNSKFGPFAPGCAPPEVAPTLTLVKTVINDNGGTATANAFQAQINGVNVLWGVPQTLSVGSHTASEVVVPGYAASVWGGDCAADGSITLSAGQNATCTITNNDIAPQLTVIEHVVNNNGGTAVAADFTMNVAGSNVSNASFTGAEAPGTTVTLNAGSYAVTETGPAGYAASFSAGCSGTIAIGESKTCTIINDDIAPTLTLIKTIVNDNGGDAELDDFQAYIGDEPVPWGEPQTLAAGSHNVSEDALSGYAASDWTGDCEEDGFITLGLGQEATCRPSTDRRQSNN